VSYTPEQEAEVLRIYRANPQRFSPFKASKTVGIAISHVFEITEKNREILSNTGEKHGGLGPEEHRDFMVARRRAMGGAWDNKEPPIAKARADYETGTHEMYSGRDGPWIILYSKPRKKIQPRPGYFNTEKA